MGNKSRDTARIFRALAVEKRVEIVGLLAGRSLCVGALSNLLRISAGAVSQHLRILRDAGLVEPERRGYFIHYRLAPGAGAQCGTIIEKLFESKRKTEKGGIKKCVADKRNVKDRKNSRASPKHVRQSK